MIICNICLLYEFLTAALKDCHKLLNLNSTHLLSYSSRRSKIGLTELKPKAIPGIVRSRGSRNWRSISLSFPISRSHLHSLAHGLLPIFKASKRRILRPKTYHSCKKKNTEHLSLDIKCETGKGLVKSYRTEDRWLRGGLASLSLLPLCKG